MTPARVLLVRVSAAAAAGGDRLDAVVEEAARAVDEGVVEARSVEEALLQSHLFLGFPAALAALERWRAVGPPTPEEEAGEVTTPATRRERGEELCRRVYGESYDKLRRNVGALHPAVERWMVTDGYGKVLGRSGLDLGTRELCIVAILAVGGWMPQLHSHLRGALRVGVPAAAVEEALEAAAAAAGMELSGTVRELWAELKPAAESGGDV